MILEVEELLSQIREMRETQDIFRPVVIWQPILGGTVIATLEGETGDVQADLGEAFDRVRNIAGPPEWFAVALDSYSRDNDPNGVPESLEEAFLNGDMSVVEQIVLIVQQAGDDLAMIRQIYRFTPADGWEWEKPQIITDPDDDVCAAVRTFH